MITKFVAFFWFVSWSDISFGISLHFSPPHIEIHVPFGFFRIGWESIPIVPSINWDEIKRRGHGLLAERIYCDD